MYLNENFKERGLSWCPILKVEFQKLDHTDYNLLILIDFFEVELKFD